MNYTHWTTQENAAAIHETGVVIPQPQALLGGIRLSWWTDLDSDRPDLRPALKLVPQVVGEPDRMGAYFHANVLAAIVPWRQWAEYFLGDTYAGPRAVAVTQMESGPGTRPDHWYVSTSPVYIQRATS